MSRIYKVTGPDNEGARAVRLVRADNPAQAIRHATRSDYAAAVASVEECIDLTLANVKVEDASASDGE